MICPACKTINPKNESTESCIQCGSDLLVHHLLSEVREEMLAKNEVVKLSEQSQRNQGNQDDLVRGQSPQKSSRFLTLLQILPPTLLLICTLFGLFIGVRLLTFLEHKSATQLSVSDKWSEAGFEQLLQIPPRCSQASRDRRHS